MDFSAWSPPHTILVLVVFVTFIGQVAIYFYRTAQNDKKIGKQGETFNHALERLEDRIDKRLVEVNQRLSDMDANIRQLNQNHIEHLNQHHSQ